MTEMQARDGSYSIHGTECTLVRTHEQFIEVLTILRERSMSRRELGAANAHHPHDL